MHVIVQYLSSSRIITPVEMLYSPTSDRFYSRAHRLQRVLHFISLAWLISAKSVSKAGTLVKRPTTASHRGPLVVSLDNYPRKIPTTAIDDSRTSSHAIAGRDLNGCKQRLLVCGLCTNASYHEALTWSTKETPCGRSIRRLCHFSRSEIGQSAQASPSWHPCSACTKGI
jgi:hypothetical protein